MKILRYIGSSLVFFAYAAVIVVVSESAMDGLLWLFDRFPAFKDATMLFLPGRLWAPLLAALCVLSGVLVAFALAYLIARVRDHLGWSYP